MHKIAYYLTVCTTASLLLAGCAKMDGPYKEFLVPSGLVYPAKASTAKAGPGRNRVRIYWLRGSDPSVTHARVFWNNYTDSADVNIPGNTDTISVLIENLPEKSYTFDILTYDAEGQSSVPVELITEVYGDSYQEGLLNTPVTESVLSPERDSLTVNWGNANVSGGAYATEIKYLGVDGETHVQRFPLSVKQSVITGINCDSNFAYRTVYLPDTLSIDTFYTAYTVSPQSQYDKSTWKVVDFSSDRSAANNVVANVIDGTLNSRWVAAANSQYPHFVTVDMQQPLTITSFEIFRQTGNDQMCDTLQLFISDDATNWTDLGVYSFNRQIDDGQFYYMPSHPKARYFKFVGLSGPKNFILVGEISVYGL